MLLERDLHKKFQQANFFLIIHKASYRIYIVIVFNVLIGIIKNKRRIGRILKVLEDVKAVTHLDKIK
jgi:hypothetical protein